MIHYESHGYRELSENEINFINKLRDVEAEIENIINKMPHYVDQRWTNIGKTHFQQGVLALIHSIEISNHSD